MSECGIVLIFKLILDYFGFEKKNFFCFILLARIKMVVTILNEEDYKAMLASQSMAVVHFWAGRILKSWLKNILNDSFEKYLTELSF